MHHRKVNHCMERTGRQCPTVAPIPVLGALAGSGLRIARLRIANKFGNELGIGGIERDREENDYGC
jgi:hypothetical protein